MIGMKISVAKPCSSGTCLGRYQYRVESWYGHFGRHQPLERYFSSLHEDEYGLV